MFALIDALMAALVWLFLQNKYDLILIIAIFTRLYYVIIARILLLLRSNMKGVMLIYYLYIVKLLIN